MWIKFFRDEACIELFTRDFLEEMAALLNEAAAQAEGSLEPLERVREVQRDFQLTLDYHAYQAARRKLVLASVAQETEHTILIEALLDWKVQKDQLNKRLDTLFEVPGYRRNFGWVRM